MNISSPACAVAKCETSSCAKCHCCETDLCLDHLKEHKDQLNEKLIPIANQINVILDDLEHFDPSTTPSFIHLEQWHIAAHETIDLFYRNMQIKLHEQVRNQPLEKLSTTRDKLNQLTQRKGATRESIASLNNDIQLIQQQIDRLRNIPINLGPLVIDDSIIISSNLSNRVQQYNKNEDDLAKLQNGTAFQIFVTVQNGRQVLVVVKPSDTIKDLKRKIEARTTIPIEQQRLTYIGKHLHDDLNIAGYGIQKHNTINLLLGSRLNDAAPSPSS